MSKEDTCGDSKTPTSDPLSWSQDDDLSANERFPEQLPTTIGRYRIERALGHGGFGLVYLAYDEKLHRRVAIKVPHTRLAARPADVEAYLTEARAVANLDHPYIVPVYDVGSTPGFPCYVVSKYIEGRTLREQIAVSRLTVSQSAELVSKVAEALNHAAQQGLVHRDVKPRNILLDNLGQPHIVDFGLALQESGLGQGPRYAGTPAYMSPEQARGEGHRVDGRSDIYSLGVVFYELLVGRRPFAPGTNAELMERIAAEDVRPLRELNDTIPAEIERICLKALARRASDRYPVAKQMADDLRRCIAESLGITGQSDRASKPGLTVTDDSTWVRIEPFTDRQVSTLRNADQQSPIRVVPKGLHSFDEHDADFFLKLLPGPVDRDGTPESLRFWLQRIEAHDAAKTFSVGLLYGPSGCGKSSFAKAGLLPRLNNSVVPIYLESTPHETEGQLFSQLAKEFPDIRATSSLAEAVTILRRDSLQRGGRKLLLVLDQFEQVLHAGRGRTNQHLVTALRQCDGAHVQALVMLRDDFWMAATRFMRDLEVPLVEGQNSAAVDLFPIPHAEQVLAAFGRAYGMLPESPAAMSDEQSSFISEAVVGLAEDDRVICVRLALFAQMMKFRRWTPSNLAEVGGPQGVGVRFLEESFSETGAPPEHRLHEQAARRVLKSLLPSPGMNIRGTIRSSAELQAATDYAGRPSEFQTLLQILDGDMRLITPTEVAQSDTLDDGVGADLDLTADEPEGMIAAAAENNDDRTESDKRLYQLTHDYLVPSLRDWLTHKQKETRRGRAELRLEECSKLWNSTPENRYLPSAAEWASILLMVPRRRWSPTETQMMQVCGHRYARAGLLSLAAIGLLVVLGFWERNRRHEELRLHERQAFVKLLEASSLDQAVHLINHQMDQHGADLHPLLSARLDAVPDDSGNATRLRLALLSTDSSHVDDLKRDLLRVSLPDLPYLIESLVPYADEVKADLWELGNNSSRPSGDRMRAFAALVKLDPPEAELERWLTAAPFVTDTMLSQLTANAGDFPTLVQLFADARTPLHDSLADIFRDRRDSKRQLWATNLLDQFTVTALPARAKLILDADTDQFEMLMARLLAVPNPPLDVFRAQLPPNLTLSGPTNRAGTKQSETASQSIDPARQANAALALMRLGNADETWPLFASQSDPSLRSVLIDRVHTGLTVDQLIDKLSDSPPAKILAGLILALGRLSAFEPAETQESMQELRSRIRTTLTPRYLDDPDSGIHSATLWALRQWGVEPESTASPLRSDRNWYTESSGQMMAVLFGPTRFQLGTPASERDRRENEPAARSSTIDYTFAISLTEVTAAQYGLCVKDFPELAHVRWQEYFAESGQPQTAVTWHQATFYCNWLSDQLGLPKSQLCYEQIGTDSEGLPIMRPVEHVTDRTGVRLPTEDEWECACRGHTTSSRYFGAVESLLTRYAFQTFGVEGDDRSNPVARLLPNDIGLFDMLGNAREWCHNEVDDNLRAIRGGSFYFKPSTVRCGSRDWLQPENTLFDIGFRIARTLPEDLPEQ